MAPGGNACAAMNGTPLVSEGHIDWQQEEHVIDEDQLKIEINTFVWMHAPGDMPLRKAEELACSIFESFLKARSDWDWPAKP